MKKNKINEGALDVGIQSYPIRSTGDVTTTKPSTTTSNSTSNTSTTSQKSTSGFKKNARVFTNQNNLKKTLDDLKNKEVDIVVTDGVEDKIMTLEYVSEVIDETTKDISKPFTIGDKKYQMVRAMRPDKTIVMGVYSFDELDEAGNCKIYETEEFEKIAKQMVNELGVQEPEGPEAATLNPISEKENTNPDKQSQPNFEGYKHFIVNEKLGKVRKFKTIQELAKAQMSEDETYMGIKEFKRFIDSALFGRRKAKETNETTEVVENIPPNVTTSVDKTMELIGTKLTKNILDRIQQNPVAQEQMILAFAERIGVPASRLTYLINGIKSMAQEDKQQGQQSTNQISERKIIKVKDLK